MAPDRQAAAPAAGRPSGREICCSASAACKLHGEFMFKRSKFLKSLAVCAALLFSAQVCADASFKVPVNYNVELVDGLDSPDNYSRFTRKISLTPGRHQIVLKFENTFHSGDDSSLIQASNPIVIEINNIRDKQQFTFKYKLPRSLDEASRFAREQKITLTDDDDRPLDKSEAYYYILASETGFVVARDYRLELQSLNRLYAPSFVPGANRGIGMTEYGSPSIKAPASSGSLFGLSTGAPKDMVMDVTDSTYDQESGMSTSSRSGGRSKRAGGKGGATFNELVKLYESADDATKLKFVKYVMSH